LTLFPEKTRGVGSTGHGPELRSRLVRHQPLTSDSSPLTPALDRERCVDCGACVALCPTRSFEVDPSSREISLKSPRCVSCMLCVRGCPVRAISLVPAPDTPVSLRVP